MGVFDDKKFEELDWISAATEPIDSQLNVILGVLPDEFVFTFDSYLEAAREGYGLDLNIAHTMRYLIRKYLPDTEISYNQERTLVEYFKFEIDEDVVLNFEDKTLIGEIKVIKTATTLDEKILESILGYEGIEYVGGMYFGQGGLSRANDVMDILGGCNDALKTKSERKKKWAIVNRLKILFKNNEWKIKDTELANKVGFWIRDYIVDGNLAAWSNFCRLKVMTHKDQPIYSMEEAK